MFFDINQIINDELKSLEQIIRAIETAMKDNIVLFVEGRKLEVRSGEGGLSEKSAKNGMVCHFRLKLNGKRISVKLGGPENENVIKIKQDRYDMAMLSVLRKNLELLQTVAGKYLSYDADAIDGSLLPVYRDQSGLVNKAPGIISTDEWEKINKRNGYPLPEDCNMTPDGIKTRSKSELIIYSILKSYKLSIKYDVEITLKNDAGESVVVSPDFIILCPDGKMIIIEHLGMLNDVQYLENVIRKLHLYIINGFKLNENLFLTADFAQGKINARVIDELVRKVILPQVG